MSMKLLFWLRKNRPKAGKYPIYCRITIGSTIAEISTDEYVLPEKWEYKVVKDGKEKIINEQKVLGKNEETKVINERLDQIRIKLKKIYLKLEEKEELITASLIKALFENKAPAYKSRTLLEAFDLHISKMKELEAKKHLSPNTRKKYEYARKNIQLFIKYQYDSGKYPSEDIILKHMLIEGRPEFSFADDFEQYGKTVINKDKPKTWGNNHCKKELSITNSTIITAIKKGWIERNPLADRSKTITKGETKYLRIDQVKAIEEYVPKTQSLQQIKDIFLFSCYTGLAYNEVHELSHDNIRSGIEGKEWIFIERKKTLLTSPKKCKIILVSKAKAILEKYKNDEECLSNQKCLPVISNTKYNQYLKVLQTGINEKYPGLIQNLTTHMARHTCAVLLLDDGFTKDYIAKMFGHKDTSLIGETYGEVTEKRMSDEFELIEERRKELAKLKELKLKAS